MQELIEKLFNNGGYVLNFSDQSFESFFNGFQIQIHSDKYQKYGTSKFKKLKAFCEIEDNKLVAIVLNELFKKKQLHENVNQAEIELFKSLIEELNNDLKSNSVNNNQNENNELLKTIWGVKSKEKYKLFISHKHTIQKECGQIKTAFENFGISCFVAHVDVEPTKEWQEIIEAALRTCDGLLAILTEDFYNSDWTNQEIGWALGKNIDIFSLSCGENPKGFIGKYQAVKNVKSLEDYKKILSNLSINEKLFDKIIYSLTTFKDYNCINLVYEILDLRNSLNNNEVKKIIELFNNNPGLYESKKFGGPKGYYERDNIGLIDLLKRKTGNDYSSKLNKP